MIQNRERLSLARVTRRGFLRGTAAAGLSSLIPGAAMVPDAAWASQEAPDPKPAQRHFIDAHVHVWTPDIQQYPLATGFKKEDMKPASFTPEELFRHAQPQGVTRVVLIQMSFYRFDNSYMLDVIKAHPGVFSGVAVIDREAANPEAEMKRLKPLGVRGFRIRPEQRPLESWLDGAGMAAMWKCGGEENLAMCHLIPPDALPSVDKMCRQYPDTPVVIDHFARIGIDGQIRENDVKELCRLSQHKQVSVKISAYYALGKKAAPYLDLVPMIKRLLDAYGPERLMWASDCPFQVQEGHTYEASISLIRDQLDFISDSDREWLLEKTAGRVFFS